MVKSLSLEICISTESKNQFKIIRPIFSTTSETSVSEIAEKMAFR